MNRFSGMKVLFLVVAGFIFLSAQRAQACAMCVPPGPAGHCEFALFTSCQTSPFGCRQGDSCGLAAEAAAPQGSHPATSEAAACPDKLLLAALSRPTLRVVRAERLPART